MYKDIVKSLNMYCKRKWKFIVQTDFRNYFGSITKDNIGRHVFNMFVTDERLYALCMLFFEEGKGLVLGNEISQLPASFYATPFDKYVTDEMKLPFYRFMDDCLAICHNKREVLEFLEAFRHYATALGLSYREEKIHVYGMGADFVFCKERFLFDRDKSVYYQMINPKRIRAEKRKLKAMPKDIAVSQYASVRGCITRHPNTMKIVKKLDKIYRLKMEGEDDSNGEEP